MATRYIGSTSQQPRGFGDIVGAAAGGTLAGGQTVQVVFDDTVYTSSQEGKERLVDAVTVILNKIKQAKTYPIDSTS